MIIKPRLRGLSHMMAAAVAIPAGMWLVGQSTGNPLLTSIVVYAVVLFFLFGISGFYHVPTWSVTRRALLRRIDRSMIYLFIAGTYTPMLAALGDGIWPYTGWLVWTAAIVGVIFTVIFSTLPRWITTLPYVALGWGAVLLLPALYTHLGIEVLGLILGGGLLFTVGGVVYATQRPNPRPKTFGYHEIFHLLVIAAVALHYRAVWLVLS